MTPFAEPAAPTARVKILLVDDSLATHMRIGMVLDRTEYETVSARDGEEGVEHVRTELPELILMDVVMNPFEACCWLRAHHDTYSTPTVLVTTRAEAENEEAGFTTGCCDYIARPVAGLELLFRTRSFLCE